jgi:hypothetical protein
LPEQPGGVRDKTAVWTAPTTISLLWAGKQSFSLIGGSQMKCARFLTGVAALVVVSAATSALAQSYLDGSAKSRGDYGQSSASRSLNSARGYTQDYRKYASSVQTVDPEVARDAADSIGSYITKAQKHFAWMRAQADKAGDKETLASLNEIDTNLASAAKTHHEMHDVCMKDNVDAASSMKCCQQIDDSLAKVIAEHDKLMKKLGLAVPAVAKK